MYKLQTPQKPESDPEHRFISPRWSQVSSRLNNFLPVRQKEWTNSTVRGSGSGPWAKGLKMPQEERVGIVSLERIHALGIVFKDKRINGK